MGLCAPTHHIAASKGEFAKTVLMPGDPLRAAYIARNYLTEVRQINGIRCMYAYTGMYGGQEVSVMAHGIGAPSMAVHAYELYRLYDVERIIRIGTAGAMADSLKMGDVIVAMGACYNTCLASQYGLAGTFSAIASYPLLESAVAAAKERNIRYQVGNVLSSDVFYPEQPQFQETWLNMGILAVEMEVAALYITAARAGKSALGLLTVSDHIMRDEHASAGERQEAFTDMMELALSIA